MLRSPMRLFCALGALLSIDPNVALADVTNEGHYDLWIKPETTDPGNATELIFLPKNKSYKGSQDGIAIPAISRNAVFKICDHCSAAVRDNSVKIKCESTVYAAYQRLFGGWKNSQWVAEHPDWRPLFEKSQ